MVWKPLIFGSDNSEGHFLVYLSVGTPGFINLTRFIGTDGVPFAADGQRCKPNRYVFEHDYPSNGPKKQEYDPSDEQVVSRVEPGALPNVGTYLQPVSPNGRAQRRP